MKISISSKRTGILVGILASLALLLAPPLSAAATGPEWKLESLSETAVEPGGDIDFTVEGINVGEQSTSGEITVSVALPEGLTAVSADGFVGSGAEIGGEGPFSCPPPTLGGAELVCQTSRVAKPLKHVHFNLHAEAAPTAPLGRRIVEFSIEGGGAGPASTVDPVVIGPDPAFGIDAFDGRVDANRSGSPSTQAGGHPYGVSTTIDFNTVHNSEPLKGDHWPVEPARDIFVELPPGAVGSTAGLARCTLADLSNAQLVSPRPLCAPEAQVGTLAIVTPNELVVYGPVPLFNMVAPPGVPARFGANVIGTPVVLNAEVRSDGDYGITIASRTISEGVALAGVRTEFWGVPADETNHRTLRGCPGVGAPTIGNNPSCPSHAPLTPFLRNPTACTSSGLTTTMHTDSWFHPGATTPSGDPDLSDPNWKSASFVSHRPPGYAHLPSEWGEEVGIDGCDKVPFEPGFAAEPTTASADAPSGLDVHMTVPQGCWAHVDVICQSDLKEAAVKLPAGMTLNPSAASGLGACTPAQIGLFTPVGATPAHFTKSPAACPDSSKIGDVTITTPLLDDPLKGAVYFAEQSENPFGSLLAMYLVAEGSGVVVKQAGEIEVGPGGRLTTRFSESPQMPFSELHLSLYGGPRATLRTPPACGEYATTAELSPWSGTAPVNRASVFAITDCPNSGFDPKLSAGTANPLAAAFSPFNLKLTRNDGTEELGGLSVNLPEGLLGSLKGIPYCSDSTLASISEALGTGRDQETHPSCPAASQVGTVTVGAGAGPSPFFTGAGRAYLAGPYKGAPLSLAVVAPAVAGPLDLGSVVVRNAIQVDPVTARITTVSDPLPTILHGIPLDLRDIRVELNRSNFTLNPTSCDPMSIGSTITSPQGSSASPSQRFQVGGCQQLAFQPKLALTLKGKTKRSGHPALKAVLTYPSKGSFANIAKAQVGLPHSEFLDQGNIGTVCTQPQLKSRTCPPASIYGTAKAWTPLLDKPLEGPVYLGTGYGHKLPDLVADLDGQIRILLNGKVDTDPQEGIRNTFEAVPDAPVEKFVLELKGGKKFGLLENSENICKKVPHATATFTAQNGDVATMRPTLKAECRKHKGKRGHKGKGGAHSRHAR